MSEGVVSLEEQQRRKKVTSISISEMIDEELRKASKKEGVSKSKLIEAICLEWLRKKAREEAEVKRKVEEAEKDKGQLLSEKFMRKILFDYENADQYGWQPVESS